ncbi:MAG: hypothetical protein H7039_05870 [Bryobacteraceae bacterium]|nr:hypothetical protein [Bryobacteraceae bacterium]
MSVTTWTRLEPDTQTGEPLDLAEGMAAKLADPLWLLGRQWQMGELTGEDAASPVVAEIKSSNFAIDTLQFGPRTVRFSVASTATEAEVEFDSGKANTRTQSSAGAILIDRLSEAKMAPAYSAALLQHYPMDSVTPNAEAVISDLGAGKLHAKLGVAPTDRAAFDTVMRAWVGWYSYRRPRSSYAWVTDRLEYNFTAGVNVPEGRITLTAPEHTGDRIDWYSFTASAPVSGSQAFPVVSTTEVAPALLQIPGMPALAFWEMEDPRFDAGRIEAGPADTARLLLIETALSYAADWFLLPLRLPVASMTKIDSLIVTDTFGVKTVIRPVEQIRPNPGWRLWEVSDLPYLLLPPPSVGFIAAEPVEKVVFVRDEAANLAWALQVVPQAPTPPAEAPATGAGDLMYLPVVAPPDDRIPLLLTESDSGRTLVRGKLAGQKTGPAGDLLSRDFRLRDEELPDEGLILERRYELGRTPDGVLHTWASRVKRTGARLPSSGLAFDQVQ